jgi:hypothetical protein
VPHLDGSRTGPCGGFRDRSAAPNARPARAASPGCRRRFVAEAAGHPSSSAWTFAELRSTAMPEADAGALSEKARRREARAIVGAYHQEQLRGCSSTSATASSSSMRARSTSSSSTTSSTATSGLPSSSGASVDRAAHSRSRLPPPSPTCETEARSTTGGPRAPAVGTRPDPSPGSSRRVTGGALASNISSNRIAATGWIQHHPAARPMDESPGQGTAEASLDASGSTHNPSVVGSIPTGPTLLAVLGRCLG